MKFRDDIDLADTWVVSDTHFGHTNIVPFCFRPEEHEEIMIAEWRAHVPDDATVIHLGDICYGHNGGNTRFRRLLSKELTGGRKFLIKGNHDRQGYSFYRDCGFRLMYPFKLGVSDSGDGVYAVDDVRVDPQSTWTVSFSHYPWNPAEDGIQGPWDIRLHGHIHNNGYTRNGFVPFLRNHINLSVEQTKYRPVNLKLLLDAALLGKYDPTTDEQMQEVRDRRKENTA